MATSPRKTVRIAVFVPSDVQLLDLACVDIFAVMGHQYLSELEMLPTSLTSLAPEVSFAYVGTDKTVGLTAQTNLVVTHHLSDPEVGPGKFDIVVVPGPDPTASWGEDVKEWLAAQGREEKTEILSICTGIFLCGEAGLLKGRKASGPRGLQKMIEQRFEGVELVGDRLRWVQDRNFWSCGGITNGNDLVAAYARQSRHFPGPVVEIALQLTDVDARPQEYGKSQAAFTVGFVWTLLKAWFWGFGKQKSA